MFFTASRRDLPCETQPGSEGQWATNIPSSSVSTSTRSFRLATTDYSEWLLLGPLLRRLQRCAPGVQVLVRRLERLFLAPEENLRNGTFDAALGFFQDARALEPGSHSLDLFEEDNVCIARRGNPLLRKRLTAQHFAAAPQIGVFYRFDSRGLIDNILAGKGLRRRLQATTPHFLSAPYVVAYSDLIACVPAGLARRFRKVLPLQIRRLPIAMPAFRLRLAWHEQTNDDPAQHWFRSLITETAAEANLR